MPKLLPLPEDKYKRQVVANIEYQCNIRGINKEHQRLILQCNPNTLRTKIKDPGKFTLDDLIRLAKKLKVPVTDFFKENV